jgi:hypothetical protein
MYVKHLANSYVTIGHCFRNATVAETQLLLPRFTVIGQPHNDIPDDYRYF